MAPRERRQPENLREQTYVGELWDRVRAGNGPPRSVFLREYLSMDWKDTSFKYDELTEEDLSEIYEPECYHLSLETGEWVEEAALKNLLHLAQILGGEIALIPREGFCKAEFGWWIPHDS